MAAPLDIHRLGHQVLDTLAPLAETLSQTLELTVEPNQGLWVLDQHTVKHILYHGLFSLMHLASHNSTLRIHGSRKGSALTLALWVSNPWLGEGLPDPMVTFCQSLAVDGGGPGQTNGQAQVSLDFLSTALSKPGLGLLLCHHLAQHHGGHLRLQGTPETGYRLVITLLPLQPDPDPNQAATRQVAPTPHPTAAEDGTRPPP